MPGKPVPHQVALHRDKDEGHAPYTSRKGRLARRWYKQSQARWIVRCTVPWARPSDRSCASRPLPGFQPDELFPGVLITVLTLCPVASTAPASWVLMWPDSAAITDS